MDEQRYQIQWVEAIDHENEIVTEEVISVEGQDEDDGNHEEYLVGEEIISHAEMNSIPNSLHQIAAENLIYMAQDGHVGTMGDLIEEDVVEQVDNVDYNDQQYFECQVTEEVITDDWVQQQGEERVEIPVGQLCGSGGDGQIVEEMDVPLPTDQDEYTALRPYPCDFCSRRFRKKASLMNHMIAHQNDRPHVCNLCGARYIRRSDLLNHLKIHAHIPEQRLDDIDNDNFLNDHIGARTSRKYDYYDDDEDEIEERPKPKGRRKKMKIKQEERYSEHEHVNEEQQIQEQNIERYPITDPRKPFVCQQCGIAFAREKALLSHSRIHGGDSPYECATCNEMFWDMNMLHDHQRTHHFEASNSEYEPENDEETESETDSKYGEYYCDVCGMSFHRQDLLKRHTKTHVKMEFSEGDSKHCCNVCGETFLEALDLLAHAEIHARFQPFKCMLCGETFLEEATIKKHLTNVHSSEMTANTCRLCGKQCRDGRALMKHAWDHSREKNHSCSKCGKTFHNKARLKRHMVSHRNKSVICDVCQEEFPDGRSLMNHRHSHNNSSGKLFPCHECGKTFGSRSSQQIHVRIHTGERPYGCRFCWKAFADGGTLRKHERIHTGEKPYACSVCPRAFNQRVVLREHIRSHHSAPDTKRGTSMMPFYCTVCTDMFSTSVDLIQHLIQHSDMNTAIHRQPITGPRKYKRRRKLKQHELEQLRNEKSNTSDIDYSDLEMGNVDDLLGISSKSTTRRSNNNNNNNNNRLMTTSTYVPSSQSNRKRKYSHNSDKISSNNWQQKLMASTSTDDTYNSVFQNLENALQNIDSLVVNNNNNTNINNNSSQAISNVVTTPKTQKATRRRTNKHELIVEKPSRPKMIHTQKTRVTVEDGKRKTRTMITRTEPAEIDDNVLQQFDRSKTITERNYHDYELVSAEDPLKIHQNNSSSQIVIKQEQIQRSDIFDAQLLLEAASMRKELEKYNPDVVNDLEEILRSPIKLKRSPKISSSCGNCGIITTTPNSSTDLSIEYDKTERNIDYNNQQSDEVRRSSRIKKSVQNKKYLEFETSLMNKSPSTSSSSSTNRNQQNKIKQEKYDKIEIKTEKTDDNEQHHHRKSTERFFQCEMCCAVFPDRTQLLVHVPVHI